MSTDLRAASAPAYAVVDLATRALLTPAAVLVCLAAGEWPCRAQTAAPFEPQGKSTLVYAGTHTGERSKGIYLYRLLTSGLEVSQNITLAPLGLVAEEVNPTYFDLDTKRRLLFTVNEVDELAGKPGGGVTSYLIDAAGRLKRISQRPSGGARPCHLALGGEGRIVFVSNCGDGAVAAFLVGPGGELGEHSIVAEKARCATPSPGDRYVFTCGEDRIARIPFDSQTGKAETGGTVYTPLKAGSFPRRILFRPDGKFAYVLNEKSSTVTVFAYDAATGSLRETQEISTLPGYFDGQNSTTEIGIHPTGRYLYASNHGHNSVVLFEADASQGTLTYVEEQGTGGDNPVHFGIQPSAVHLAIANRDTNQLLVARIDSGNGRLKPSGVFTTIAAPACVRFLPPVEP